jgi:phage repressor protein C with HTH and peptisase S24 domain
MSQASSAQQFLEWVDRHKAAPGRPKATDRAMSHEATGNPDALRSIRRNVKEGKQHGVSTETIRKFEAFFGEPFRAAYPAGSATESVSPQIIRPGGPEQSTVEAAPDAPALSQFGDFDVEVRGIAVGGEDDEFYFNGEVIDHIRRPPGIKRAKNVFALNVSGDSMMPRYEPGEPIYVQRANPVIGDYVVVELYPEDENQAGKSFLKKLERRTGRRVVCSQFNPPKELEFDAGEVKEIYRVLKPRDLLG